MIKATIGDLLDGQLDEREDTLGCVIYVVRDGDLVLYVGKAIGVIERLWSHLGEGIWGWIGISRLGRLIQANLPAARRWQIELMTGEDCLLALKEYAGYEYLVGSDGTGYLLLDCTLLENGTRLERRLTVSNVEDLECELIRAYHPCLNSACNLDPTPLPDHYQIPWNEVSNPGGDAAAEAIMPKRKPPKKRRER